jgi:hypothetical protein
MRNKKNTTVVTLLFSLIGVAGLSSSAMSLASASQPQNAGQPAIAKRIGTIKSINGNVLTLAADSAGPEITVAIQPSARLLRLGADKDVKNAAPIQLQDLQVGDTIRARGQASDDNKSITGLEIIVITRSAVQAVSDQMRQDWLKRGIGGPVSAVDPAAGTVTITTASMGGKKTIVVHTSKSTVIRRYAPDSAKPEDAKVVTLQDVHIDDQLRARGNRSADGSELTAEEIFTGVFPQFPSLIKSVDASAGTLSVQDLVSKKTVDLKIAADSQLHKIPAEMANRFAARLKGSLPPGTPGAGSSASSGSTPPAAANAQPAAQSGSSNQGSGASGAGGNPGGGRPGGAFDFQRLLDQTPAVALADLHKGDAVYVLTTEGTSSGGGTVIKLVAGIEPILQASPNGGQAMMLAPWSLGGAPGGDAGP